MMDQEKIINGIKRAFQQAFPDEKLIPNNFDEIIQFVKKNRVDWQIDETTKKQGTSFLDEAVRDIESCKALSPKWCTKNRKVLSHAAYHLQQAVEKAMKGYCLATGILSISEVKGKKGHDTPYFLLKAILENTGMKVFLENLSQEAKVRFEKAWDVIENPQKRVEIAKMSITQIRYRLSEIDKYKKGAETLRLGFARQFSVPVDSKRLPLFIRTMPITACLQILGTITFPHEAFTRYTDGSIVPDDYKHDMGIVQSIPEIISYLVPTIKQLREILEKE
jgi:hypothetical protein